MAKYKLAVLTSHPIQHQAPLFKRLAIQPEIDLTVYFCWDFGIKKAGYDKEMGREIKWDIPLLDGYKFKFLRNFSLKPSSEFWGQINPGVVKEFINNKYDAVWILSWNSFTNWLAFLTAFFITKTPVFLRGENPLNQEVFKNPLKNKIKKIILKRLFKRISAFLYIGEENKKFYQHYGVSSQKLFFCPYSDDNDCYIVETGKLKPKKDILKKELGIVSEKRVILFVGKLIDKKRPLDLIQAYKKIADSNVVLVIVGDGVLRLSLEDYVKNNGLKNVYFTGFKNLTELTKYYAIADILVLPSGAGETWGLVVNIAMCFKMPVVVSDVAGCGPDLVKNGINGYIFPLGDVDELAANLKNLLNDKRKMALFGENSFKIIKNYSYDKNVEGIINVLKNVCIHNK
ncbi:MAG: glycosyltransferase family 4 protein [Patescibacteria group bacterium]|nr:glycosyltransferase family 4 protein [Patescibacteria group bacterium]